jgi:hypothetical protein
MADVSVDVAMTRIPPLLDAVRVTDRELCPGSTDRGAAFLLWEQVRSGLLAQSVANDKASAIAHGLLFRRRVSPTDRVVQSQTVEARSGRSIRPFVAAATAATFATRGYLEEDAGGRIFRAPDSEVLLDESFAATHCFRLQAADAAHSGEVGLAFTPVPGRSGNVDVSGVIWIDQAIRELRSFDFLYTELEPAAIRAEVGGHMVFTTAANGVSFIEQWSMRLPVLAASGSLLPNAPLPRRRQDRRDLRLTEIEETGGLMLDAKWDDGTTWTAQPMRLAGVAIESRSQLPIGGAIIALDGTADRAVADARGAYEFTQVVPGKYSATISDTSLSAFISPRRVPQLVDVIAGSSTQLGPLEFSAADAGRDACKERRRPTTLPIVAGRVETASDVAKSGLALTADWSAGDTAKIDVDDHGQFLLCGVPSDRPVRLRLAAGRMRAETTFVARVPIERVLWRPSLVAATLADQRVIRGVVRDTAGRPLSGVQVNLVAGQGTNTDDAGRFRLAAPSREDVLVDIRRLGFTPSLYSFSAGGDTTLDVTLLPAAQQLAAVNVNERSSSGVGLAGFDERMRARERGAGAGYFITGAEIERRQATKTTSLFDMVPGIFVLRVDATRYSIFARGRTFDGKCVPTVFIDGTKIMEKFDNGAPGVAIDELLTPSEITGIEVYASGNAAPPAYQLLNGSCAVVLIWTKRGR